MRPPGFGVAMIGKKIKLMLVVFAAGTAAILFTGTCLADFWEESRAAAGKISSVSAEFVQEKHMKILSRPIVSEGVFLFRAPDSLRWEYRSPVESVLLSHDGKTRRFVRREGVVTEDASAGLRSMQVVLQDITRWLEGRFDENPAFSVSRGPGRKIVMSPRDKALAVIIQRIELILSDRPGIMESVMIYEGEDSYTRLVFRNVIINRPLEDSLFRVY